MAPRASVAALCEAVPESPPLCQRFLMRCGEAAVSPSDIAATAPARPADGTRLPLVPRSDSLFIFSTPVKAPRHWAELGRPAPPRVALRHVCIRCLEEECTVVHEPCRHQLYCVKCLRASSLCGACGRPIDQHNSPASSKPPLARRSPRMRSGMTHAMVDSSVVEFETRQAWQAHLQQATEAFPQCCRLSTR